MNRKIKRILPASWKYFFRSVSDMMLGSPAKIGDFRFDSESERTIKRPPMTDKLRRKKFRSKIRPYPNPCATTTRRRPAIDGSGYRLAMTSDEQLSMTLSQKQP